MSGRWSWVAVWLLLHCNHSEPTPTQSSPDARASATADRMCRDGNDWACNEQFKQLLEVGDRGGAAALAKRLCLEEARRNFCPNYAFALDQGHLGSGPNRAEARELFEAHCRHNPVACSEFGSLYVSGLGMPQDLDFGQWLLELACQQREPKACRDLSLAPLNTRPRMLSSSTATAAPPK